MAFKTKQDVLFILSVDTEEEWDWNGPFPQHDCSVTNILSLPHFQDFCQQLSIRPTYFVDYPVASDPIASNSIRQVLAGGDSEIGAHLHSWCNPPYYGDTGEFESHLVNLPEQQVGHKLDELLKLFDQQFNVQPSAFRSGRWGINGSVLKLLIERGISVDSSVYPFYRNGFFSCENSPLTPYWPDWSDPLKVGQQREMMEIPVSVGFNHRHFELCEKLYRGISSPLLERFRLVGFFWQLKLLRKLYLSPELCSGKEMISLASSLLKRQQPVLHMYLHSSSLVDGVTGLMNTKDSLNEVCKRIKEVVMFLQTRVNLQFCTISEARDILKVRNSNEGILK